MEPQQNQPFVPNSEKQNAAPPVASVPESQPAPGPYAPEGNGVFQPQTPPPKKKKIGLMIAVIVVLIAAGGAGAVLLDKQDSKKQTNTSNGASNDDAKSTAVPNDWKLLDTALGFSVKAPTNWKASPATESTINNLKTNSTILGLEEVSADSPIVVAATQALTDKPGQQAFEDTITKIDPATEATLEQLGIKKEDIKLETSRVKLGDKEWLQVDVQYPNQASRTLYLWNGDHEIALTMIGESADALSTSANKYLSPMAASVVIN